MVQEFDTLTYVEDNKMYVFDGNDFSLSYVLKDDNGVFNLDNAESISQDRINKMSKREFGNYFEVMNKLVSAYMEEE